MEPERNKTNIMKYLCGPKDADRLEQPDQGWGDIEIAIRQLNGHGRTLVLFGTGTPAPHMAVGGGSDGRYIVYASHDNVPFHTTVGADRSEGKVVSLPEGNWMTI